MGTKETGVLPPSNRLIAITTQKLFEYSLRACDVTLHDLAVRSRHQIVKEIPDRFQLPYAKKPNPGIEEIIARYERQFISREKSYHYLYTTAPDFLTELCMRYFPDLLQLSDDEVIALFDETIERLGGIASFMGPHSLNPVEALRAACILQIGLIRGQACDDSTLGPDETLGKRIARFASVLGAILFGYYDSVKPPVFRKIDEAMGSLLLQPGCQVGKDDGTIGLAASVDAYFTYKYLFTPEEVSEAKQNALRVLTEELRLYGFTVDDYLSTVVIPHQEKYTKNGFKHLAAVENVRSKLDKILEKHDVTSHLVTDILFGRMIGQISDASLELYINSTKNRLFLAFSMGGTLVENYGTIAETAPGRYSFMLPGILGEIAKSERVHPFRRDSFLFTLCNLAAAVAAKYYYDYVDECNRVGETF